MPFLFNFVSANDNCNDTAEAAVKKERPGTRDLSFTWILEASSFYDSLLQKERPENELITFTQRKPGSVNDHILRVREESSSFSVNQNTDLVPGVYEGGLKVWECSMDLCRYFHCNNVTIEGHVLELGCGHALPGIWVLKQAISRQDQDRNEINCFVTFSDFNEFVIRDVTIPNVALNVNEILQQQNIGDWLNEHVAFGAGDWLSMRSTLLAQQQQQNHPALPKNGLFDCILASETTYSEKCAAETAELLSRHLKRRTGVAYIATKRYYFGVGGGTRFLCDALEKNTAHKFHIETLEVYDTGAGNIRELLLVKSI